MKNKLMVGLIAFVVLLVSISGCVNQTSVNTTNTQVTQPTSNTNQHSTQNNTTQTNISASEAKTIAQKSIAEPGATAGEPKLVNTDGTLIYVVPVLQNGKNVGEIDVDAQTGEVVGGAGGAPT